MFGLSVRWSLDSVNPSVRDELTAYVVDVSLPRFQGMADLRFKTWRMTPSWFEGTYVFATETGRDQFAANFAQAAETSPVSRIVGEAPVLQEHFQVLAVAEGAAGFASGPGPARIDDPPT